MCGKFKLRPLKGRLRRNLEFFSHAFSSWIALLTRFESPCVRLWYLP
jgi:hypothetical protein